MVFSDNVVEEDIGVGAAVFDGGGQAEMIGATGQNATAAIFANQQELGENLFSSVFGRQAVPPGEAADVEQFGTVIEDVRAAHPGNLVAHQLAVPDEFLLQVER